MNLVERAVEASRQLDGSRLREGGLITVRAARGDTIREALMEATVHKYRADQLREAGILEPDGIADLAAAGAAGVEPYETRQGSPFNLLVYGGASALWDLLIAAGNVTAFNNANAHIGVGNSTTAAAATQTDLQGASKSRKAQEAGFPSHTDGTGAASNADCQWKSQWGTADGNFAWEEWGLFNASTAGRMLNRKVESLGTKTSAAIWTLTITLTLS